MGILIIPARLFGCQQRAVTAATVVRKEKEGAGSNNPAQKHSRRGKEEEGETGDQLLTKTLTQSAVWVMVHFVCLFVFSKFQRRKCFPGLIVFPLQDIVVA